MTNNMMSRQDILIGEIKGAHGVKGLVRVAVYADDISLFNHVTTHCITLKSKHKGDIWLASIDGIADKDAADALKGTQLQCPRTALKETSADEIYYIDLIGKECIDEGGNTIGTIIDVQNFGAGDLLDIRPANGGSSFYLSYSGDTILGIDQKITVRLPEVI